jgi:hypothetical protein
MVWAGLLATQLFVIASAEAADQKLAPHLYVSDQYRLAHDVSSIGRISQVTISASVARSDVLEPSLELVVTQFYDRLFASQEPLGSEFSAILNKHRWDLYES